MDKIDIHAVRETHETFLATGLIPQLAKHRPVEVFEIVGPPSRSRKRPICAHEGYATMLVSTKTLTDQGTSKRLSLGGHLLLCSGTNSETSRH